MSFFSPASIHQAQYSNSLPLSTRPLVTAAQPLQQQQPQTQQAIRQSNPLASQASQSQPLLKQEQQEQQQILHSTLNHGSVTGTSSLDPESSGDVMSFAFEDPCITMSLSGPEQVLQSMEAHQHRTAELLNAVYRHDLELITDLILNYHV